MTMTIATRDLSLLQGVVYVVLYPIIYKQRILKSQVFFSYY